MITNFLECGSPETLCKTRFDEILVLEFTDVGYGVVHHLTIAAYMIQHSSKLTLEGWLHMRELLRKFLVENKPPVFIRKQNRDLVDCGKRKFKIISKNSVQVINKIACTNTILDFRTETAEIYCADVAAWVRSVLEDAETVVI